MQDDETAMPLQYMMECGDISCPCGRRAGHSYVDDQAMSDTTPWELRLLSGWRRHRDLTSCAEPSFPKTRGVRLADAVGGGLLGEQAASAGQGQGQIMQAFPQRYAAGALDRQVEALGEQQQLVQALER